MLCVLDCSVAISWLLPDEACDLAFLEQVAEKGAMVSSIWALEVANVLEMARRSGRLSDAQGFQALDTLKNLPITLDPETATHAWGDSVHIARQYTLSLYDASYLELALRKALPLATLDKQLHAALTQAGLSNPLR